MAEIGELTLMLQMPWFGHRFGVASLAMKSATLHLSRDQSGRANWQWTEGGRPQPPMHIVRSLSVPDARVTLDDARRHLEFHGTASARSNGSLPFELEGSGELNGHAVSFEVTGDPLAAASHDRPYGFTFSERSSGTLLEGHGSLPRPFDFDAIQADFDAEGSDLKDLYYLTGVSLINTGKYRLSGKIERDGPHFAFTNLSVKSGESDARGSVSVDSHLERSQLDIRLESRMSRSADIGLRAAARAPTPSGPPLLLSDASFRPEALRTSDAIIAIRAANVQAGRMSLRNVAAQATLERGVLTVSSLTADLLGGKLEGHGRLDANENRSRIAVDIRIAGLELAELHHKAGAPPLEGTMRAHIVASGAGSSLHEFASSANGTVTAVVPKGTIRDSLAELTGLDLRGLGLLLAKNQHETDLRCAAGVFKVTDGTLATERFVADTDPVLITGDGRIQFKTESLDLHLGGEPKSLRLFHFRSPIAIGGTLARPSIGIEAHHFEVVDTGKAKDVDCASLITSAESVMPAAAVFR